MHQALWSYGCEHGGLAQCIHLSSRIHWDMDLLCIFPATEPQVPCSVCRHWPVSTLSTSQKAPPTPPASWAAGEEKGWEEKALEPQLSSFTGTGGHQVEREGLRQGASKSCGQRGVFFVAGRRERKTVIPAAFFAPLHIAFFLVVCQQPTFAPSSRGREGKALLLQAIPTDGCIAVLVPYVSSDICWGGGGGNNETK